MYSEILFDEYLKRELGDNSAQTHCFVTMKAMRIANFVRFGEYVRSDVCLRRESTQRISNL